MKLLFATGIYPPEIGGPATYAVLMEAELRRRGWEVDMVPFRVVRSLPPGIRHLAFAWRLWKQARGKELVFAQDTVSVGLPALFAARLRRLPLVIRVPGDFAWEQGVQRFGVREDVDAFQGKRYGWRVELLRWIQRIVVNGANGVIAPSQYFAQLVRGWVRHPAKVRAIYNGVALPDGITAKRFDGPTLITAGRLVPWKRIDALLQAMPHIPEARLCVVGEGPDRARLEELAQELGVRDRVQFIGALPRLDLLNAIAGADLFLLGSTFESFSFQLVEAMMVGAVVVAHDIGNLREIITPDKNGVLLPKDLNTEAYAETIRSLLHDPARCTQIREQAVVEAKRFSVEATADAFEAFMQEIVSSSV